MEMKDREIGMIKAQMQGMESKVKEVEHVKYLEATVQTQKWEEFEKLAESMRNLSHTMSTSGSSTTRVIQY